jgi:hypothetical protein
MALRNVLIHMPIDCQWVYWCLYRRRSSSGSIIRPPGIAAPPWVNKLLGLQYDLDLQQQQKPQQPRYCGTMLLQQLFLLTCQVPWFTSRSVRFIRVMKKLSPEQVLDENRIMRKASSLIPLLPQSGITGIDKEDKYLAPLSTDAPFPSSNKFLSQHESNNQNRKHQMQNFLIYVSTPISFIQAVRSALDFLFCASSR